MEANAALRNIVRFTIPRRAVIETPTNEDMRVWTVIARMGFQERPRGQGQDEGRHHAPGLQGTRWIWTWWRRNCTRPTRAIDNASHLAQAGCGADGFQCVTVDIPAQVGRPSPSPSRRVLRAGTEMMRLAGRSPTTGPGCYLNGQGSLQAARRDRRALRSRRYAPDLVGAARTCTSDTCFTSPATTYRCDAPTLGAGTPKEAVAGGICLGLSPAASWSSSQDGETPSPRMLRRGVPGQ